MPVCSSLPFWLHWPLCSPSAQPAWTSHLLLESDPTFLLLINTCLSFRSPREWTFPRVPSLHLGAEVSLLEGFPALGFSFPSLSRGGDGTWNHGAPPPEFEGERCHLSPAVSHLAVAWEPLSEHQFFIAEWSICQKPNNWKSIQQMTSSPNGLLTKR